MPTSDAHRFFRPILILFTGFLLLQLFSGLLIYLWKIGLDPARGIEYYFGSERMLALYPDRADRFIQGRSLDGLLKVMLGHFLAYGIMVFFLTHLARSLAGTPSRRLERACAIFFGVALFEICSGLLIVALPFEALIARVPALVMGLRALSLVTFFGFTIYFVARIISSGRAANPGPRAGARLSGAALIGFVLCVLLLIPAGGCQSLASRYAIESHTGANGSVRRMSANYLGGAFLLPGKLSQYSAQLNLQIARIPTGPSAGDGSVANLPPQTENSPGSSSANENATVVSFYGRFVDLEALLIPAGDTLELEIDGQKFRFTGRGSEKLRGPLSEDAEEPLLQEAAYWHHVPEEVLVALYRAKLVRIRVQGAERRLSYFATDSNRSNFRRFIRDELPELHARISGK